MTRMTRPCSITYPVVVNDGKPFDARTMDLLFHIFDLELSISNYDEENGGFIFYQSFKFNTLKELEDVKYSVQWQLGEALNAPVLVTEEVLAGLPKDARILGRLVCFDEDEKPDHPDAEWQEIRFSFLSKEWLYGVRSLFSVTSTDNMMRWYIIKANGCPKTAKYLSQFYTDGRIQV